MRQRAALQPPEEQARHALAVASGAVSWLSVIFHGVSSSFFFFLSPFFSRDRGLYLRTPFLFWHPHSLS
jgi:hypothetical protein